MPGTDRRASRIFESALELRPVTDGAETATANETAVAFDARIIEEYKAVIHVTALDFTTTDESYIFDISVSDAQGGTFTKVATLPDIGSADALGIYEVPLSGSLVDALDADADWIRVGVTLAGTSPSVTYGCFLTKV
jgi:hypothetical protein